MSEQWVMYDENDDRRNAQLVWDARTGRWVSRPSPPAQRPPPQREVVYAPAPTPVYAPTAAPPPAIASSGNFRIGVLIDVAAQALAAVQPLPQPPRSDADTGYTLADVIEYNEALAKTWQRNMQLRTLGSIGRAFLP